MTIDLEKLTLRELQKESARHCSHKTVQVMVYQNTTKKSIMVNGRSIEKYGISKTFGRYILKRAVR